MARLILHVIIPDFNSSVCIWKTRTLKMLLIFCSIVFISGGTTASRVANLFMDHVIHSHLQTEIKSLQLDPAKLEDIHTEFSYTDNQFGNVKVEADFFYGILIGISRVKRFRECQGPYFIADNSTVNCTLVFDDLDIKFWSRMKSNSFELSAGVKSLTNTSTLVFVEITEKHNSESGYLRKFEIRQVPEFKTNFTGEFIDQANPITMVKGTILKKYTEAIRITLQQFLHRHFKTALFNAVTQVPVPDF